MARRQTKIELTLFPFLSVLVGLIAVLILFLIAIIATRVFADISSLQGEGQADAAPGLDEQQCDQLRQRIAELQTRLAQRQREREELRRAQQELGDLLEAKRNELALASPTAGARQAGVLLGRPEAVKMVPSRASSIPQKPVFLEVSAAACIVHPEGKTFAVTLDADGKYTVSPDLAAFIASVDERRATEYIVFLIHPNGFPAWDGITDLMFEKHRELKVGWEPFSPEWVLMAREQK